MRSIQTFQVFPDIPEPLSFIETLSRNLWWSWNQNAIELFRRINPGCGKPLEETPLFLRPSFPRSVSRNCPMTTATWPT
nr:DUF3417 domain-containing protein [Desulfosarcina cetonica]